MNRFFKIQCGDPLYPFPLKKYLANESPACITAIGNLDILQNKTLAIFSSIKCPGNIILTTYDMRTSTQENLIENLRSTHDRHPLSS
jgi:hypothetical protein